MATEVVRFAVTPPGKKSPTAQPFAAQLALSRVHSHLVPLERVPTGDIAPRAATVGWYQLHPQRGLAGYGLARALRMLLDVLVGLTALEQTRTDSGEPFVHGELVPALVRVDRSGCARLIPLAPWHWSVPGTAFAPERRGHLAPERLLGDALDPRADVFSAGVLLWEALAGRRLFEHDAVDEIVTQLLAGKVTLTQLPPELAWAVPLKAVARRALSVDPKQRFANSAELAAAIEAVCRERIATHADVAGYFGAPERFASAPPLVRAPAIPKHYSSLSALVAPLRPLAPPEPSPVIPVSRDSSWPASSERRRLWAVAAISCLFTAVGVGAVARHEPSPGASGRTSQLAQSLPLVALPPSASAAHVVVPAPSQASLPIAPGPTPIDAEEPPPKSPPAVPKRLAPKFKLPTKAVRSPDKAAAKYGI